MGPGTSYISIRNREMLGNRSVYNKQGHFYTGLIYLRGSEMLKHILVYSKQMQPTSYISVRNPEKLKNNKVNNKRGHFYTGLTYWLLLVKIAARAVSGQACK